MSLKQRATFHCCKADNIEICELHGVENVVEDKSSIVSFDSHTA